MSHIHCMFTKFTTMKEHIQCLTDGKPFSLKDSCSGNISVLKTFQHVSVNDTFRPSVILLSGFIHLTKCMWLQVVSGVLDKSILQTARGYTLIFGSTWRDASMWTTPPTDTHVTPVIKICCIYNVRHFPLYFATTKAAR